MSHLSQSPAVADLEPISDPPPPPTALKFSQFHAVFFERLAKSYVGAPSGRLAPPPTENPGYAPA